MKKVLLIHTHGGIGGAGQSLLDIVKILKEMPIELTVACPKHPSIMAQELKRMKVDTILLDKPLSALPHYNGASLTRLNLRYWIYLLKVCTKGKKQLFELGIENYDAIYINSTVYAWITRYIPNNIECYCFHRETYMGNSSTFRNRILMSDLSRCKAVAFISEFDLKKTVFKSGNTRKYLIPDAVDIELYDSEYEKLKEMEKLNLDTESKYLLFVGGHNWIKGGNIAVKALKYIEDEKIKLIYMPSVSSDKLNIKSVLNTCSRLSIEKIIKKYSLEKRVIFFPAQTDMTKFYKIADIVVFPSVVAHQARPIYEAGACHKTIVITDFEETKENLIDRYNGLTFYKKDIKDLANKISFLLSEKEVLNNYEENNYRMTLEKHNIEDYRKAIKLFLEID